MGNNELLSRPIIDKKIAGNIRVRFYDRSRPIAGDRWLVKLDCEAVIPAAGEFWGQVDEEDKEILACTQKKIGANLTFSVSRERNFIAEQERQSVLDELMRRVEENIMHYLDNPEFPRKLFAKQYKSAKEKCLLEKYYRNKTIDQSPEDDDGEVDFSELFKNK